LVRKARPGAQSGDKKMLQQSRSAKKYTELPERECRNPQNVGWRFSQIEVVKAPST
jgi:hypothetical protein